jgi:hypothetical protein
MLKLTGIISLIAGVATLVGYFVPTLASQYYLVLAGGIIAILAAVIDTVTHRY